MVRKMKKTCYEVTYKKVCESQELKIVLIDNGPAQEKEVIYNNKHHNK